ncbi:hypothetical protein GALMADRAFT_136966 [Galerina marginata CBS 339.88]|uniref:Endonuclease/exonuclease/phosphatase domain-containing protein n=1 Tax=Galerina marginata (strain CBS 339.88) TaxID=685588 RepID=A0A067TBJ6_GALM3|nr:hypothetical protein GALMADRAFT_136966 [Galerina marginata CBS 339.88]
MGVYSDADHTAIKLLAEKANSLPPMIYMGGDFNCHSSEWDPDCRSHGTTAISLLDTAATLGLELAIAQNSGPTFISHNPDLRPSVIDLVFVPPAQAVSLTTCLEPELKMQSDHVPISPFVPIRSPRLDAGKRSVPLVDQTEYLNGIIAQIWGLPITDLTSPELVEAAANTVAEIFADAFTRFSKLKSITSRSSPWWTPECATSLATYRASLSKHDWKSFRKLCKEVKRKFFEERIVDIAYSNKRPWDLMNWVQKRTLPACEALSYQGAPCISLDSLWNALHGTYNSASGRGYDLSPLDTIPAMPVRDWVLFSMFKLTEALSACSSRSAPGPDHISWGHLKWFVKSEGGSADLFLRIANGCLEHSHWPSAFKDLLSVIIPKPGKPSYSTLKSFRPIVLLNTLGKLIETWGSGPLLRMACIRPFVCLKCIFNYFYM